MISEPDPRQTAPGASAGLENHSITNALGNKIDFRLTTSPPLANLRRHEQYRVEFW
jgi:hypothetical protein